MLLQFLGPWLYWPLVVACWGYVLSATASNAGMLWAELLHQGVASVKLARKFRKTLQAALARNR